MKFKMWKSKSKPGEWLLIQDDREDGGTGILRAVLRKPPECEDIDWKALCAMLEAIPVAAQRCERLEKALKRIAACKYNPDPFGYLAAIAEEALQK